MGGALTLGAASKAPFDAAAPFYGVNFDLLDAAALKDTPVQGHFGKLDEMVGFSDPTAAAQLEAVLKAAGNGTVECHLYDGVGHAFMNASPAPFATFDAREEALGFPAHDPTAAETAWTRLFAFLGEHLK
jgi:carboxymethylenebutenolidase